MGVFLKKLSGDWTAYAGLSTTDLRSVPGGRPPEEAPGSGHRAL